MPLSKEADAARKALRRASGTSAPPSHPEPVETPSEVEFLRSEVVRLHDQIDRLIALVVALHQGGHEVDKKVDKVDGNGVHRVSTTHRVETMTQTPEGPLRAPARARPSESLSSDLLSLSQDHKETGRREFQDTNGAGGHDQQGGQRVDTKVDISVHHASTALETKGHPNGSPAVLSFEVSEGGEADPEPDPWGLLPKAESGTRAVAPEIDAGPSPSRPPLSIMLRDPPMSDEKHRQRAREGLEALAALPPEWEQRRGP